MYRFLLALFAVTLFCACETTNSTTGGMDEQTEETTEAGGMNTTATTPMPAASMSGDNYEVTTTDGSIKSPRKELKGTIDDVAVTINYGSPAVNGRTIYGDLVPYGKVWRTGANEATRITFDKAVEVGDDDTELAAGTYALFTIPREGDEWTVIFNKVSDQWGAYDYDGAQDAARVEADVQQLGSPSERMDFTLGSNSIDLRWADRMLSFEVEAD